MGHSHHFALDTGQSEKKVIIVFAITTLTMVLEIVAGTWFSSMALMAGICLLTPPPLLFRFLYIGIHESAEEDGMTVVTDLNFWKLSSKHLSAIASAATPLDKTPDDFKDIIRRDIEVSHLTIEVNRT